MARKNRNLAAKAERARREARDFAQGINALEATRPQHARLANPVLADHWGLEPAPITREDRERALADCKARGRVKVLASAEYDPRQSSVNARHIRRALLPNAGTARKAREFTAAYRLARMIEASQPSNRPAVDEARIRRGPNGGTIILKAR